mmetsp:Transcript_59416/g.141262  ORF Transcript_59416/g.141262 Transcript_59416/m.141262 type:complete len:226 (+) Transcript_59416:45-722(+)
MAGRRAWEVRRARRLARGWHKGNPSGVFLGGGGDASVGAPPREVRRERCTKERGERSSGVGAWRTGAPVPTLLLRKPVAPPPSSPACAQRSPAPHQRAPHHFSHMRSTLVAGWASSPCCPSGGHSVGTPGEKRGTEGRRAGDEFAWPILGIPGMIPTIPGMPGIPTGMPGIPTPWWSIMLENPFSRMKGVRWGWGAMGWMWGDDSADVNVEKCPDDSLEETAEVT